MQYCPELDSVYLVPVEGAGKGKCYLRVDPPKNNWGASGGTIRLAEKYKVA